MPLGHYAPGTKITGALQVQADVLIILYTEEETRTLLEVFTGNNDWSPTRQKQWCGYAHNFATFKPTISGISGDPALEAGIFGYLSAMQIGSKPSSSTRPNCTPKPTVTGCLSCPSSSIDEYSREGLTIDRSPQTHRHQPSSQSWNGW